MQNTQKRITGRASSTYTWEERSTGSVRRRTQPVKAHADTSRKKKASFAAQLLPWMTLTLVVLMISMIIGKWSAITEYKKLETSITDDAYKTATEIENVRSEYRLETREDIIKQKAKLQLGMIEPDANSIYVLENIKTHTSDVTMAAEGKYYSR